MRKFKHDEIEQIKAIAREVMEESVDKSVKKTRTSYRSDKSNKKEEE